MTTLTWRTEVFLGWK